MRARNSWMVIAVVLLAAGPVSAADSGPEVGEARKGIEAGNASFGAAFAAGDAEAVASHYTEDAALLPPEGNTIRGREAIASFWKGVIESGARKAELTTAEVGRSGDMAWEVGTVRLTVQPEGKEAVQQTAKYVVVWQRQSDGSWKLHRDIWNSSPPAQP